MAAATTDKLRKVARRWVGQIGSGGVADDTVTTIPLSSSTNLPTGTAVSVVIDRVDANGTETPTLEETSIGIVSSTNLVSCVRGEEGTAQAHDAGAVVEVLLTSNMWNDMVDWGVVEHSQLGVHTTAAVTTLKATGAEINTGTEDGKIVTPKAIEDSYVGLYFYNPNVIINPGFTINQRVWASDAVLADGIYGHDRWKGGASGGDYTFTQLNGPTTVTIKADKSLIQVVDVKNVVGGTYTLSWTGTAQARFGTDSATPSGDYADSPITATGQTAGTAMSVEFGPGTVGKVSLTNTTVALPFQPKSYEDELRACQRYYVRIAPEEAYHMFGSGVCTATTTAAIGISIPVTLRAKDATVTSSGNFRVFTDGATDVTTIATDAFSGYDMQSIIATVASGLTAGQAVMLQGKNDTTAYLAFDAEL